MADARLTHCASCCKSEAHRLQRQGRTTQRLSGEMFMERGVESGLSKRVCQGATCWCEVHEQRWSELGWSRNSLKRFSWHHRV
jgi:hypothetical protein